jgi:chromosome transmission fidelity protein 18
MAPSSSPILYPPSSSPPAVAGVKRAEPHDAGIARPAKPVARGGFLVEDDSDDDEQPALKKRAQAIEGRIVNVSSKQAAEKAAPIAYVQPESVTTPPDSQPEQTSEHSPELGIQSADGSWSNGGISSIFENIKNGLVPAASYRLSTCAGKRVAIHNRIISGPTSYERMIAARSKIKEGRAVRTYYGIEMHELVGNARKEMAEKRAATRPVTPPEHPDKPRESVEVHVSEKKSRKASMLWTEKYRARSFKDLVGDDMTNRQVLRWLKGWDATVFPHASRHKTSAARRGNFQQQQEQGMEEKVHRKILLLAGPPGLGKTTLAHVCARQAGYEVLEINASDDRSRDVVKGRIRTCLGTENVKTVENRKAAAGDRSKVARPVCVVVDEVDGAVTGTGGAGEGGFVKALIDLVLLGQRNSSEAGLSTIPGRNKKKGDDFRQMRPLILICNDVYHPALRPLRQSGLAEIIHAGRPTFEAVVTRLKTVFEHEGIPCEKDAVRKVCEAAWGMASGLDAKTGRESTAEGDIRGIMVVGEWVACRLRAATLPILALTRNWVEQNVLQELAHGGGGARGIGRGGLKDIATRIFQEGAGFPRPTSAAKIDKNLRDELPQTQLSFSEQQKKYAIERLREMIETSGETDRVVTEVFSVYPEHEFNDDSFLTKPNAAYEWLHFHDSCASRIFGGQDWELGPYLSQAALACHHLFASPKRQVVTAGYDKKWGAQSAEEEAPALPFTGPRADYEAYEAEKANRATLQAIQAQLSPTLSRAFRSPEHVATDFLPYLVRLVSPDVKPVIVGGSGDKAAVASVRRDGERAMVHRATEVLADVGISVLKGKIEEGPRGPGPAARTQWVYRMEPLVSPGLLLLEATADIAL